MNDSTDGAVPRVRADWYIVPWGLLPGHANTLRYSIRVVPQLCEGDEKDCFSIDALRNWPAHIAQTEHLQLQVVPPTSAAASSRANLSQQYLAHLCKLDLTLEQASQLWHAAIGELVDELAKALHSGKTTYRSAPVSVPVPKQKHDSSAVERFTQLRIGDLCAGSLHLAAQVRSGSPAAALHGRVQAAAPSADTFGFLRASAAIYAAPNKPQRSYQDIRQSVMKRAEVKLDSWATTVLDWHAQAPSDSSGSKAGGSAGASGERTYLPYSVAYLNYLLTVSDPNAPDFDARSGDEVPLDDFGMQLGKRRLAYASTGPVKLKPDQCKSSVDETTPQQKTDILIKEIQGRISSMIVHPWLAKILGLTVDMALPLNDDVSHLKSIGVESFKQKGEIQQTVAQILRTRLTDGFAQSSAPGAMVKYKNGVLNVSSRDNAFLLTQMDVDRTPERYVQTAVAFETQLQSGQVASKIAVAMQPQETVGLSLIECGGERKLHALTRLTAVDRSSSRDVYLEQLLIGYRPDLKTLTPADNDDSHSQPWHALTARRIKRVRLGMLGLDITSWFSNVGRCEAFLPERTRTATPNGDDKTQAFIEGEMFRWSTWGLGAGPTAPTAHAAPKDCSLAVKQANAYDGGSHLSIEYEAVDAPPQRFGHLYRVGVRLAMIDGNSIEVGEAASVYEGRGGDETWTIGDDIYPKASDKGILPTFRGATFRRFEPVAPPTVLMTELPVRDRFVKDAATHVVVASGESGRHSRKRAWRALVPPRSTSLDLCARHGMFDAFRDGDSWPPSAFADVVLTAQGDFPVERYAYTGLPSHNTKTQELYFRRQSTPPPKPRTQYYPDPWARCAILGFYRVGDDRLMCVERFDYYAGGRTWPNCREMRLCVEVASTVKDPAQGFEVRMGDDVVTVLLQPGVQVTLRVWHEMDVTMLQQSAVVEQMAQLALGTTKNGEHLRGMIDVRSLHHHDIVEIRSKLIDKLSRWEQARDWSSGLPSPFHTKAAMLNLTSFWMLNPFVEIDLLHAVDRPTRKPYLVQSCPKDVTRPHAQPSEFCATATEKPFQIYREAGQTKAVFQGHLYVDRASTIRVDATAQWTDNPPMASRVNNSGAYLATPKVTDAHLFALKDVATVAIDDHGSPPSGPIAATLPALENFQLLEAKIAIRKDDQAESMPAVEEYDFMDARARVVDVQLSGASRYADEFANLTPAQAQRLSALERVIVYGTKRPDPPEVEYVVPVFNWSDAPPPRNSPTPDHIGRTRDAGWFRIWLGSSWYSSGNGELLALLCWPGRLKESKPGPLSWIRQDTGEAFTEPDPAIERYITRWGVDALIGEQIEFYNLPIDALCNRLKALDDLKKTGDSSDALDVDIDHLQGLKAQDFEPAVDLAKLPEFAKATFKPLGKDHPPASQVMLALYRPELDAATGKMFVDIQLDPRKAYQPFVRLGLARYQARGLNDGKVDCRLSTIVSTEFVQLLPERTASLSVNRTSSGDIESVQVALFGTALPNTSPLACRSRFVVTAEQRRLSFVPPDERDEINGAWLPVNVGPESVELTYEAADQVWQTKVPLPLRTRVAHEYSIRIEEYEMLPIDKDNGSGRLVYFDRLMIRDL